MTIPITAKTAATPPIIAGPCDPKTGKLHEGWAQRITRLRERLNGVNVEETNDRVNADAAASQPIGKSVPIQARIMRL